MTDLTAGYHAIALIGGPLCAHDDEAVVRVLYDYDQAQPPPQTVTALPSGLRYDLDMPDDVGRYQRVDEEGAATFIADFEYDGPLAAVYRWEVPS